MLNSRTVLACVLLLAFAATASHASVFEIDDQGGVSVRHETGEVQWVSQSDSGKAELGPDNVAAIPDAALTMLGAPQAPDAWRPLVLAAADRYGVSPDLLAAVVWQESRWHSQATSSKGAMGLAQLMPATARAMAIDARDPAANLAGGAQYLRQMLDRFDGNIEQALAAYNAGPGRVLRAGGIPAIAETRAYVSDILLRLSPAEDGLTGISK